MRYFMALEIPQNCQKQLEGVQRQLKEIIPQIRLTDSPKLHLTIAFIGEQPDYLKEDLRKIIVKAVGGIPPFTITPGYIDGFPHLHSAHVFWVGAKGDIDKLMIIRERIKDGLSHLGLDTDERRYVPHIAIAKINGNFQLSTEQEAKLQNMMLKEFAPIQISSIKLFESVPEEGFHHHNTLAEVPLTSS
ncbi:MAG: 2'-5' RNA ligase [Candidatus Daviesbacteria bacterium GW2011_GWA1_41_61]|uniref:RNA 2',3'-cyclic phosphodiesterase n=1 Tax=Candidatus Daviesbacteria bacterium GW2011_GWA2_40_9 TaxID=1618424 RepID=A0A0G0U0T6_9BACT|nr:MAG: 2'-5' RNA ligase, 2'-5' RNA ligase [Candidatus Daviesbacteria bacterium GW2011_GWC1_40_9]KKR82744.1 MAG: 2'-5' RNA ligase [Candidatus Daviesbacteria bacterium GW2011_GWA2_40_9]KKR93790.1 MAG: 2'-5' RNA ligase [Candidatus Daviesbacteria bacterium GW2011_GWB1_41_15]KKS15256.1 MAG: 2'-5' RNA ligase [Candidatus Daviesbacteria bacterium GW2011_GWA1_41_61]